MARRRRPLAVVDTNVFVASFLSRSRDSVNRRIIRAWLIKRKFVLVVSSQIVDEYLRVFRDELDFDRETIERWRKRFRDRRATRRVVIRRKIDVSRDASDNVFIAAAVSAKARFVVTNDRDLLEIDSTIQRELNVEILAPEDYLHVLNMQG